MQILEQIKYLQLTAQKGQAAVQANLSHFCESTQGIDIIPLAFLSEYGAPLVPGGNFGACNLTIREAEPVSTVCQQVADDIKYCQAQKNTILLSPGGGNGNYGLSNQSDAETLAQEVRVMYGPLQNGYTDPRPLGDVVLDGS
jgi:chitinase